jgi:hypothetical protein
MHKLATRFAALLLVVTVAACSDDTGQLTVTGEPPTVTLAPASAAAESAARFAAEDGIRLAFANFANTNVSQAERDAAVEGGERASAERAARWEQFKGQAASASFVIDDIRLVSATEAEVDFRVRWGDRPSPVIPDVVRGSAVLQAGNWRVSKATACKLAAAIGNSCLV